MQIMWKSVVRAFCFNCHVSESFKTMNLSAGSHWDDLMRSQILHWPMVKAVQWTWTPGTQYLKCVLCVRTRELWDQNPIVQGAEETKWEILTVKAWPPINRPQTLQEERDLGTSLVEERIGICFSTIIHQTTLCFNAVCGVKFWLLQWQEA